MIIYSEILSVMNVGKIFTLFKEIYRVCNGAENVEYGTQNAYFVNVFITVWEDSQLIMYVYFLDERHTINAAFY